jgi:hypothetical protein
VTASIESSSELGKETSLEAYSGGGEMVGVAACWPRPCAAGEIEFRTLVSEKWISGGSDGRDIVAWHWPILQP